MALRELLLPWDGLPQEAVSVDDRWIQRGLRSAYLLQPGVWDRNLVTGAVGGVIAGTGFTFSGGKLRTPGSNGNGALLDHGLDLNIELPVTFVVGWRRLSGTVAWSLLRTDASPWSGWYGEASGTIKVANNNTFDGEIITGDTDSVAFSHRGANDLVAYGARRGRLADTALTTPASVANSQVCLGYSRRDTNSNAGGGDFTHFYAFQGALTDSELAELANEPGQLFAPRRIYIPGAVVNIPGVPTLSAATISLIAATSARVGVTITV